MRDPDFLSLRKQIALTEAREIALIEELAQEDGNAGCHVAWSRIIACQEHLRRLRKTESQIRQAGTAAIPTERVTLLMLWICSQFARSFAGDPRLADAADRIRSRLPGAPNAESLARLIDRLPDPRG